MVFSETLTTFATASNKRLAISTERSNPSPKLDEKLETWRKGFAGPDVWDVDRIVNDRRLPPNAANMAEGWLRECRGLEHAVSSDNMIVTKLLYNGVERECQDQLYCIRNMLVVKTQRFLRIRPGRAKLTELTASIEQEGANASLTTSKVEEPAPGGRLQPWHVASPEALTLELVRRYTWTSDAEAESEEQDSCAGADDEVSDMRRRPSLANEADQKVRRLQCAMKYKWPVNLRRAKTQYEQAMERQEWERV